MFCTELILLKAGCNGDSIYLSPLYKYFSSIICLEVRTVIVWNQYILQNARHCGRLSHHIAPSSDALCWASMEILYIEAQK